MNQEIAMERDYLRVRCRGDFSLSQAKVKFLLVMDAVVQHQTSKVLVDVRELNGNPTTLERYDYSTFAADNVIRIAREAGLAPRLAYLGEIPLIDPERFGETVARNRGVDVKVYETREIQGAFAWLKVILPEEVT